jgi:class 3 adenylate cyclase/tetratricopeptide (TPR) repeat protein
MAPPAGVAVAASTGSAAISTASRAALGERFASPQTYTPKHLAEKIFTSRSAIEGERKQVTVMFTDVSGFTAMSSRLDPEDVHEIMDRCFEVVLEAVHRYEGTVNQFLGDGVMALFGAPVAHEDHADRATRAALAIQQGLEPLRADVRRTYGRDFLMRIGINTGLVVVGAIGRDLRMDYTAVGDTTNLAARLLNIAAPGQVVVSERIRRLRDGFFVFEDLGPFELKGKKEPVRAFAVTDEMQGRTRLEVSKARGLTPLAGRKAEWQRLHDVFLRARQGEGEVVLISGDPGVGKSRLVYEFLAGLDPDEFRGLEATCVSYGRTIPYRPITDLLRRFLLLPAGVGDDEVRQHVEVRLRELGLHSDEATLLLSHFLDGAVPPEFLGRLQGAQLKERTHRVLADVLARADTAGALVIVVENIHWIDASSEEFLRTLVAQLLGRRQLLMLTTRTGSPLEWLPPKTEIIALQGLAVEDLRGMVRALLGAETVAEPLFELLLAKGEGNPLYVEEIVRQLRETAGIRIDHGEARLAAADVSVPDTINDIIAARVDRLPEPLKQMLQVASVMGRRFGVPLLSRVAEADSDTVARDLRELHGLDFVYPSADERDPFLFYSFKHALTQDVVYGSLLERRRRLLHAAVGHGLEDLHAAGIDDVVELLAYQFGKSGEDDKAVDYAMLAAEKAQRRWANFEALAHFEAAERRLERMEPTDANRRRAIDAVVKQAEVKFALGRHAAHVAKLEAIRALVDGVADLPRRAAWYYWAGFLHSLAGTRLDVSIEYCNEAVRIADAGGFEDIRAFAECALSHVYLSAGHLHASLEAGERALAYFEARGNIWWACRTLWALNPAASATGEWDRALRYARTMLDYGLAVDDLRQKVVGWWRTAATLIYRGDAAAGLDCCREAAALAPTPFDAAMLQAVRGIGWLKLGDHARAVTELAEAVAWFDRAHLQYTRVFVAVRLAEAHLAANEPEAARATATEAIATSDQLGYVYLRALAERVLGDALTASDVAAAARHVDAAADTLEQIGARNDFARALTTRARVCEAAGDVPAARQSLERALAIFEELGTLDEPPRVRAALATLS